MVEDSHSRAHKMAPYMVSFPWLSRQLRWYTAEARLEEYIQQYTAGVWLEQREDLAGPESPEAKPCRPAPGRNRPGSPRQEVADVKAEGRPGLQVQVSYVYKAESRPGLQVQEKTVLQRQDGADVKAESRPALQVQEGDIAAADGQPGLQEQVGAAVRDEDRLNLQMQEVLEITETETARTGTVLRLIKQRLQ